MWKLQVATGFESANRQQGDQAQRRDQQTIVFSLDRSVLGELDACVRDNL